jgi:hypothetical protein
VQLAGKAVKAVEKSGPDPVVFIFLALVFLGTASLIEPKWLTGVILCFVLAAYCWRRHEGERHEMAIAKLKLEQERAKVHAKKNALRIARGAVQPMLPLNSVNTDENEL